MVLQLHRMLQRAATRFRRLQLWSSLAICWFVCAAAGFVVSMVSNRMVWTWPWTWLILAAAGAVAALACWAASRRAARNPRWVARRIEAKFPELSSLLLAAVEQTAASPARPMGYLQTCVVKSAIDHGRRHRWSDPASRVRLRIAQLGAVAALAMLVAVCALLFSGPDAAARSRSPASILAAAGGGPYDVRVEPGDEELERGSTLLVVARFNGPVPPEAQLALKEASAESLDLAREDAGELPAKTPSDVASPSLDLRAMVRSFDDPQFVGRVAAVENDFVYHVEFDGQRSRDFHIRVFEYPKLLQADLTLEYPEYTRLPRKVVEDVRRVTVVEGARVRIDCRLNKRVDDALLVDQSGEEMRIERSNASDPVYGVEFTAVNSLRMKLHLVDDQARSNKKPPEIIVNVTPNTAPKLKIARPARDVRVSPIEELELAVEASDDFGVIQHGIGLSIGGGEVQEIALGEDVAEDEVPAKVINLSHVVDFESLGVQPDQLVSYFAWADDHGADGRPRRTMSDMFFAEVRPFDEVFREGQQQTEQQAREQQQQGAQQGGAQQAAELAELQKQIVNATWNLIRRERGDAPPPEYADDVKVVSDSQQRAIEQAAQLGEELKDDQSRRALQAAQDAMAAAVEKLQAAASRTAFEPLRSAIASEQSAYQALLRLRARELSVSQSQQGASSGSSSGSGNRSQQQLQQLELSADENRYETQSRAQSARDQQQLRDQSRQTLDRLRQLARRQEDVNRRLRELQSALQAAQQSEQRREIERELKRLRDQQRELLRDADQLRDEMANGPNSELTRQASEQLEETRSRVQQASEALEEGRIAEALTEGTRASRELNELRDKFREQTAAGFGEEVQGLRDAARELDQRQQELAEQLSELNESRGSSLRPEQSKQQLADEIEE
ncbi:MAG: hypothetical protein AAF961_02260, partial [Planctomycetota bacterium]